MPYPQIMQCHCFKNDNATVNMALVLALPSNRTILSFPVHAIDAANHARKPSSLIDRQQTSSVLKYWLPEVIFAKHRIHSPAKLVHGIKACVLTHSQVPIEDISS